MTDQTSSATVRFTLTSSDIFLALAGHTLRRLWFLLPLPVLGAISVAWAILDPHNGAVTLRTACWILVFGGFVFAGRPYLESRTTMKNPNFGKLMILTVSVKGIEFTGEQSNGDIGWAFVKGVSETPRAVLINLKPGGLQIVPKRQIPPADMTAFKTALRLYAPGPVKLG